MSGQVVSIEELQRLFEAARWAPSSGNQQPWSFVVGRAGTPGFQALFETLVEGNKVWCARAGALVLVLSRSRTDEGRPIRTHSFDTGAAWMSLALQASSMGLVAHGMGGFDYDKARVAMAVPEHFSVECMLALGHPGSIELLPEPLRVREEPNDRNLQSTFVFAGTFGSPLVG